VSALDLKVARQLQLELRRQAGDLHASLYQRRPKDYSPHLVFTYAPVGDCRLHIEPAIGYICLWVRGTCFRLTANQAQQVRAAFPDIRVAEPIVPPTTVTA
jgi:hypothetical protein